MKTLYRILIIIAVVIVCLLFVRFVLGGSEDDWIQNEKGVWVKHGNPSHPSYVLEQQRNLGS